MKTFLLKYKHAWILSYIFIYIPWFVYLEHTVTEQYYIMHMPLDDYIPFNEYFIIPYFLWFFYVSAAVLFLLFTDKSEYYKLCGMLFSGMTISLIICSVFPNGTNLRPVINPDKNIFSAMVCNLYAADTCTNVFPSIHVFNSIAVFIAIHRNSFLKNYLWIQILSLILMVSICLSTVYLKQHSVVDGIGSIVLIGLLYLPIYGIKKSPVIVNP